MYHFFPCLIFVEELLLLEVCGNADLYKHV